MSATGSIAHFDLSKVIRPNILQLQPYRCARDDYKSGILLDANENSLGHSLAASSSSSDYLDLDLHRYPDPSHDSVKALICSLRGVSGPESVFLGVGSDEVIDMLIRVSCIPGRGGDKILITPPTYGMYKVAAQVNDVDVVRCDLQLDDEGGEGRFKLRIDEMKKTIDKHSSSLKLIFLCSPGNPTGTLLSISSILSILNYPAFKGIVVVDEAYIDFAPSPSSASAVQLVSEYPNLVVSQTLSKGFGLAGLRLGIAIANPATIQILNNTKAPYNVSSPSASLAHSALSPESVKGMQEKVKTLQETRAELIRTLTNSPFAELGLGKPIGQSDANFVLIPILSRSTSQPDNTRALSVYKSMAEHPQGNVVVRYRGGEPGCKGCIRITIGTNEEMHVLQRLLEKKLRETLE